jgi:hypothetical protein
MPWLAHPAQLVTATRHGSPEPIATRVHTELMIRTMATMAHLCPVHRSLPSGGVFYGVQKRYKSVEDDASRMSQSNRNVAAWRRAARRAIAGAQLQLEVE